MDKLNMQTKNLAEEKYETLKNLFPNAVTETIDENGEVVKAIDKDILMQEISSQVVEGREEKYQFTWPDKRKSILAANAPTSKTLRPCREESLNFDTTENLYIEGDNLEVLKLLQETYLGKIKMIYIDPPYNTGKDFVYKDNFSQTTEEYLNNSGQYDEEGNRLEKNLESNGRFHTDWLNMIYPRLKLARNLLTDDGIVMIHIDENEIIQLVSICREIFGMINEMGIIVWDKRNPKGSVKGVSYQHEYIVVFSKNYNEFSASDFIQKKENADRMISFVEKNTKKEKGVNNRVRELYSEWMTKNKNSLTGGERAYKFIDSNGKIYREVSMAAPDKPETRSFRPLIHPVTKKECPVPAKGWRYKDETMDELLINNEICFGIDETTQPNRKYYLDKNINETVSSVIYYGGSGEVEDLFFSNPKPIYIAKKILYSYTKKNDIVLDFFSGSATTADAVMQLNAEDGGNRKFIMVQLPEKTDEKSEAYKAGYENICEIGKERIRRAGKKILEDNKDKEGIENLDIGFRVLKTDTSNMKDVFYAPVDTQQSILNNFEDNIKEDRTAEDLLFQVMLDLGVPLSSNIDVNNVGGKEVFMVEDNYLIACFDNDVTEEVVREIAKSKPYYAVFRDSSMASDSLATNFEQIFESMSPETIRKVI